MLLIGLLITFGIGSSFATVPMAAVVFMPVCIGLNLNIEAVICLLTTAAVLGDTGSPASEVTVMTTSILNENGDHHHMKDTVIPTFIHYNIPLLIFGMLGVYWLSM